MGLLNAKKQRKIEKNQTKKLKKIKKIKKGKTLIRTGFNNPRSL